MPRIADKIEFMKKRRAVKVCAKARIGKKVWYKNVFSYKFSKELSRNRKFLIVQGNFGKFIAVVRKNYVF